MSTPASGSAFTKLFRRRDLFEGQARWAWLWGVLSGFLLVLWLLALYLLLDLAQSNGRFEIGVDGVTDWKEYFAEDVGLTLPVKPATRELLPPEDGSDESEAAGDDEGEAGDETADDSDPDAEGDSDEEPEAEPEPRVRPLPVSSLDTLELNAGILTAVWRSRDEPWYPLTAALYRYVPPLRSNQSAATTLILALLILSLLRSWVLSRHDKAATNEGLETASRLRQRLHRQVMRLGPSDLDPQGAKAAFTLFTDEVSRAEAGVKRWVEVLTRAPIEIFFLLLFAFMLDWRMAYKVLVPLLACGYLIDQAVKRSRAKRAVAVGKAERELNLLAERFQKTRLVLGYRMESDEHARFQSQLDRYANEIAQAVRQTGWSVWVSRLVVAIFGSLILYLVVNRTLATPEEFSLPTALALLTSFAAMASPLSKLWHLSEDRLVASQAATEIHRYLDRTPEVSATIGAEFQQPLAQVIELKNVSHRAGDRKLLDRLNLKIPAGQVVAIVSNDPLEAKALVSLLPRFLEPSTGQVLFDGEDIKNATLESLRAECIMVSADDAVFSGTVTENLSCGDDHFNFNDITEAAKLVHAHQFITRLEGGYEAVLGAQGQQLDAGELFRLGLARAVLRNPALLIIEEPSAPLDEATKGLIDDAYARIFPGRTVLILPSRLSTLRKCHGIAMLHEGRIYAVGQHAELVQKNPLYRHWEYLKFNEFRSLQSEE